MKPNQMTICRDDFETLAAFKQSVSDAVNVLLENNYNINIKYDDIGIGIVVIYFDYADEMLAERYLYWLDMEEADTIDDMRQEQRV